MRLYVALRRRATCLRLREALPQCREAIRRPSTIARRNRKALADLLLATGVLVVLGPLIALLRGLGAAQTTAGRARPGPGDRGIAGRQTLTGLLRLHRRSQHRRGVERRLASTAAARRGGAAAAAASKRLVWWRQLPSRPPVSDALATA